MWMILVYILIFIVLVLITAFVINAGLEEHNEIKMKTIRDFLQDILVEL